MTTDPDGGTTILKFEPHLQTTKRNRKSGGHGKFKNTIIEEDEEETTIIVPTSSSISSGGVASTAAPGYKSISIIASGSGAETAALGLVSIGNFETSSTSLEPQSIIVENIDLEALNPAFVTSSGNHIIS